MKKYFNVSTRLLFIMIAAGFLFILFVLSLYYLESKSYKTVTLAAQEQLDNEIESLLCFRNKTQNEVVWDYTYWNDFIPAIEKKDNSWFLENITTILSSFHMDYVCVYDTSFNLIYEASSENVVSRNIIPESAFKKLKDSTVLSFYVSTPDGILRVSAASVHPSNDPTHKQTAPSGYFFIAKCWNPKFIEDFSALSSTRIKLFAATNTIKPTEKFNLNSEKNLRGADDHIVGKVLFTREYKVIEYFRRNLLYISLLLLVYIFLTWIFVHITLARWVAKPLSLITSIIGKEDLNKINELQKTPWEFRQIGLLFERHLEQKEELLKAKIKAEESDKLKSSFLANMSHEIRTPMNSILGFAELLKDENISGEQRKKFVGIIEENGRRMLNLINDLVNVSKIEAGQIELNISEFNLEFLIDNIYNSYKPTVEAKGLQFVLVKQDADKNIEIWSDREKLNTIVSNLVKNAVKYTKSGYIKFGFDISGNDLTFFVHDTGIGISIKNQEIIFHRFIQADTSFSKEYEGAGLGLVIAKAFVESLGGKIRVESELGVGSSFYFTIPCKINRTTNEPLSDNVFVNKTSVLDRKSKILIADDDISSQILLSQILKEVSDNILIASNGMEAVEICKNNPDIDIILMDIKMPKEDGFEATRKIRKFNTDVIIIAQTAFALASEIEKTIEVGCNDHVPKPIVKEHLLSLIRKYVKKP